MTNRLLRAVDGLTPARLVWLLAIYAAVALLLAACTQQAPPEEEPPPDPALELALDQAAVEIVRGATALIEVTVVRTGTVTEPVELNVEGALPPGVSATFDPASLSGSEDVSTLTIEVEASAAETNLDLEVKADAGGLSSSQLLSVEVVGLVVNGRLEDSYGQPLPGGRAGSQGKFAVIGSDGSFTLEGLAVPYDLMIGSGPGKRFHVFEGLTAPEPVLVPHAMLHEPTGSSTALIEGLLLDGDPLAANERVDVCVEGHVVVLRNSVLG